MDEPQSIDQPIAPQVTPSPIASIISKRISMKLWFIFGVLTCVVVYFFAFQIYGQDYLYNVGYLDFYPTVDTLFIFVAIPIVMLAVITQGLAVARGAGQERRKKIFSPTAYFIWGLLASHVLVYLFVYGYNLINVLYVRPPDI